MAFYVTPTADAFLQQLAGDAGQPLTFRIQVNPQGQSGRRIEVDLEEQPTSHDGDVTLLATDYRLVLDQTSMEFLADYHMDYDDAAAEPSFTFHHDHK